MAIVKLLQWNVWYHEKYENVVEFLGQAGADVICLQELTEQNEISLPELIAKELGYNFYFEPTVVEGTENTKFVMGNAVLSKFPIVKRRSVLVQKNDPGSESYETEDRRYVEVVLDIGKTKFTVGTVHLSYSHEFSINQRKLAEAHELYKAIKSHKKNFILTGDLNATPESSIIQALSYKLRHAGPGLDKPTWTTKPFSYNGFIAKELNWRLDYVFTSPDVNVRSAKILKTKYSDHLPIMVSILV